MVENEVREESAVLVTAGRIPRKVEAVALEILPEELGGQRVVLGSVLRASLGAFESASDRIGRIGVAELHATPMPERPIY